MADDLSPEQIRALGEAFADPVSAGQLLEWAGLGRGRHPAWPVQGAEQFWGEVSRLLRAGALVGGRASLLALAGALYPANRVFGTETLDASGQVESLFEVPWPPNPNFVGREQELAGLRTRLAGTRSGAACAQVLYGLGGVGKTQLAVEYAYRFRGEYDLVWWVAAERPAELVGGLAALAVRLGVAVEGRAAESASRAVDLLGARGAGRWLVVVDNAGAPPEGTKHDGGEALLLAVLRAAGRGGHVLVTSRDPTWLGVADAALVDVLPRTDAVRLLRRRLPGLPEEPAGRVAELLGDLPLAVEQAAAWLSRSGMAVDTYCGLVGQRTREVLSEGKPVSYPVPVAATWTLAVERLDNPAAVWLLRLWALCGPEPIPASLIGPGAVGLLPPPLAPAATDPLLLGRLIQILTAVGLVRVSPEGVVLHRLVQAVLREHTPPDLRDTARRTLHRLLVVAASGDPGSPDSWPTYAQLLPHALAADLADSDEEGGRRLILRLGRYLRVSGDYHASLALGRDTYRRWRASLGEGHEDTLQAASDVAGTLRDLGDWAAARTLEEKVLALRQEIFGDEHPDTLTAAGSLANTLGMQGDYPAARALEERVLAGRRAVLGDDHVRTLTAAAHLAKRLRIMGEYAESRALGEMVVARRREVLGENHPDTLAAMADLANTLDANGDHDGGRVLGETVLARRRTVLGEDHPHTLRSAWDLAETLRSAGDHGSARTLLEETITRSERILGADHPDTLSMAVTLAGVMRAVGAHQEARVLLEDVLARGRDVVGDDHPRMIIASAELADVLFDLGDYPAARVLTESVLAREQRMRGENHPATLLSAADLARVLHALGESPAAQALEERVLSGLRQVLGDDHPYTQKAAASLAATRRQAADQALPPS
ncbi:ATP-binding protein [Frankia sp. CcI49]|uniref:FxSxx-COOH system tetratricopeptide repeat protein n=1 Tax=Frankia sp. CcI49 TaxID=1745382 RepID=UPI000976ACDA|nr:FxSxx-COOH system tetratricopeptide repeat protein [Frankia sp. CcI49]ONH50060.1 ATP-binding protein [Frankia sp. CcI49]